MKYNKGFAPLALIAIIVGVLVIGGGAYYLGIKKNSTLKNAEENNLPQENKDIIINNQPNNEPLSPSKTNPIKTEQKGPIQLLSLKNGQKIISGSTIIVQYEITEDKTNGLVSVGEKCMDQFFDRQKGVYSFECKIRTKLGPINASVVSIDYKDVKNTRSDIIILEVIAPTDAKPVEFSIYPDEKSIFAIVGNDSPYIAVSIKYSDDITREIPFSYLKYSLDDPSLISFLYTEKIENTYYQKYIANKGGETILHLEYQGLKKDIPVEACSPTGNDHPC